MIQKLIEFQRAFNNHHINLSITCRNKIIQDLTCYLFTEFSHSDDLSDLVKKSEIVIIDKIDYANFKYAGYVQGESSLTLFSQEDVEEIMSKSQMRSI